MRQRIGDLAARRIVDADNGGGRAACVFEDAALGGDVAIHAAMPVEMVGRQIEPHRHIERRAVDQIELIGAEFQDINAVGAEPVQRQGGGAEIAADRDLAPDRTQNMRDQRRRGRFAVGAGDADEARFVGVTGTNGKSTTTALIAHILGSVGRKIAVGGNLGTAALSLDRLGADGIYVLELSSYQLDLIDRAAFDVAVWLNLTPDHLDRHGGMDGYIAAKRRIFKNARGTAAAIIGIDDSPSRKVADALAHENAWRVTRISVISESMGGVVVKHGCIIDETGRSAEKVIDLNEMPLLPGRHNWQNAAAAYAATRALGLARADIVAGIASFPGLAHRQERVATRGEVRFINDSKATNADAAATALACYDAIYWIAGGVPKAGGIAALTLYFSRIRRAFLIGDAARDFAATLGAKVPHEISGTLDRAVAAAFAAAQAAGGPAVVLLSPACASFDQFSDFEARGEAFRALVNTLPEARS